MSEQPTVGDLSHVQVEVRVELGRTTMRVRDLAHVAAGAVVRLDRPAGSPVDLRVNDEMIARGELVSVDSRYGVRITEIIAANRRAAR